MSHSCHRACGYACAVLFVMLLSGCRKDDQTQTASPVKAPEVTVAQVVNREVTDYGEFTGRTSSSETVDIRSRVTGYLTEINFTDGQEVKKGDPLFQIDPRPFKADLENAEGQKAQWVAKLARARADVKRYEELVPTGAASAQDLDKAKADMGEATAAIKSSEAVIDRAKLDLEFSKVTAPLAGQVGRSMFSKGNLIRADADILTTIVSLDPMYVYFDVDERALLRFRDRAATSRSPDALKQDVKDLKIPVFVGLANEEGYPHQGIINFADNRVDPSTGTIRVRATLDNSKRTFKPGLFTRVRVPVSDPFKTLLVSDRAIATDQGQKYVYVVDDKDTVAYRAVQMGRLQDDGLRVITAGLQPGDWVIVNGIQRARPGKPVTPQRTQMPRRDLKAQSQPVIVKATAGDSSKGSAH
jgi:RND family efflux transporter MFP subunit